MFERLKWSRSTKIVKILFHILYPITGLRFENHCALSMVLDYFLQWVGSDRFTRFEFPLRFEFLYLGLHTHEEGKGRVPSRDRDYPTPSTGLS